MNLVVVGVGDCRVSNDPESVLVTYALGTCIAVMIHDPVAGVGGLLHFMLPNSSLDPAKARQKPFVFADTGIPLLFHSAYDLGAEKGRLVVSAVGGAQVMDQQGNFNIGMRNHLAMRKILRNAGVPLQAEEVGGAASRTVRLEVSSGRVSVREAGAEDQDLLPAGSLARRSL
ncbi:MAG: chemotaxis protein CheD [Bryobacteraceae bacterium]|jgi:chemotaxis protein CheD